MTPRWNDLYVHYDARRVNHSVAFLDGGTYTSQAESYFSRVRRADRPASPDQR